MECFLKLFSKHQDKESEIKPLEEENSSLEANTFYFSQVIFFALSSKVDSLLNSDYCPCVNSYFF